MEDNASPPMCRMSHSGYLDLIPGGWQGKVQMKKMPQIQPFWLNSRNVPGNISKVWKGLKPLALDDHLDISVVFIIWIRMVNPATCMWATWVKLFLEKILHFKLSTSPSLLPALMACEWLNCSSPAALLLLPKLQSNRILGFSIDWVARE